MRIKMYENFVNDLDDNSISFIKKFKSDVEDIFVELLDNGYHVDVKINLFDLTHINLFDLTQKDYFRCDIIIYKNSDFNFIDVKEYIIMFETYISDYDYIKLNYNMPGVVNDLDSAVVDYVKISVYIKNG